MLRIGIASDLHYEFSGEPTKLEYQVGDIDVLVLNGDIDNGLKGLEWGDSLAQDLGIPVIYVAGNHEYYKHQYQGMHNTFVNWSEHHDIFFLDNEVLDVKGYQFIGSTLWTDFGKRYKETDVDLNGYMIEHALTDYRIIKWGAFRLTWLDIYGLFEESYNFIEKSLKDSKKNVLVTHHGISPKCHDPKHGPIDPISHAFWSDLRKLVEQNQDNLLMNVYGHTHSNIRFQLGITKIETNQLGYPSEKVWGFDPKYIVTVE